MYESCRSFDFAVDSGMPQGSNLGSLLFVIFIVHLCRNIYSPKLLFADDLEIYLIVCSYNLYLVSIDCIIFLIND